VSDLSRTPTASTVPTYAALRDRLRAEILSGKIPAGTRLTTAALVERFGYSQMPMREALQALHGEGLIEIQPHRGAGVLPLDATRVRNIYDLRGAVEVLLVRLCIPNLTNAALAGLGRIHARLREAVRKQEAKVVFALNNEFHDLIYRHSGNPEGCVIYDRYASLLGGLRGEYGYSPARLHAMVDEHEAILEALRLQDERRLETLMRTHVEGAKVDLLQRMAAKADPQAPNRSRRGGRR